jgi:hypothetical protein
MFRRIPNLFFSFPARSTMAGLTFISSGHLRPPLAPPPSRRAHGPNPRPTPQPRAAPFALCPCREHCLAGRWPCACDHILRAVRANRPHSGPARENVRYHGCVSPCRWLVEALPFPPCELQQQTPVAMEATTFYSSRYKKMVFTILPPP